MTLDEQNTPLDRVFAIVEENQKRALAALMGELSQQRRGYLAMLARRNEPDFDCELFAAVVEEMGYGRGQVEKDIEAFGAGKAGA